MQTVSSTYSQPVLHASLRLKPGSREARRMTAGSGRRLFVLYGNSIPNGASLKMCLESLLSTEVWNSSICLLRWKVKVTPSNRLLFQLAPSMRSIDETGSGLWRTPTAEETRRGEAKEAHSRARLSLNGQVKGLWATPRVDDSKNNGSQSQIERNGPALNVQVKMWSLNPTWTSVLMGYPPDWTEVESAWPGAAGR